MNKSILVVFGGSRGIGRSCIKEMQSEFDLAFNISRSKSHLPGVKDILFDLAIDQHLSYEFLSTLSKQKICVVYSASSLIKDSVYAFDKDKTKNSIQTNITSLMAVAHNIVPKMAKGSSFIVIGSTLSEKAIKQSMTYIMTKHAQAGVVKSIAQDTEGKGITSCLVCPGFTNTEMLKEHLGNNEDALRAAANMSLHKRLIEPTEISKTVKFVSHNPIFNGSIIHANLGQVES